MRETLRDGTCERWPEDWATTQNNLGVALSALAGLSARAEAARLLGEAVAAYRAALTVRTRDQFPQPHEMSTRALRAAEERLRKLAP